MKQFGVDLLRRVPHPSTHDFSYRAIPRAREARAGDPDVRIPVLADTFPFRQARTMALQKEIGSGILPLPISFYSMRR
jgi:hypothetical protein